MSLLTEIKTLLSGVSNVKIGTMPDTPDNSVALYNTGGYTRDLSGSMIRQPTFMVKVRNADYASGETVCSTIANTLHGVHGTGNFLLIAQEGDIQDLGRDESNRQEWTLNFRCYYKA